MNNEKSCVDCKHYYQASYDGYLSEAMCNLTRKATTHRDMVYGLKTIVTIVNCFDYRNGECGHEAKLFEPKVKNKWWQIWK